ncbi:hypothetical protein EDB84DRAFT_657658 [Lactarius hengduanensis]|nr:hypothetical protein EDB84DRAFT_657658 [Lactarius hengduanensis]
MSLPRTSPPLQSKKRKVNDLESTEEDEASVNRRTKIIRFMDPEPTQSATPSPSYRLLDHDHSIRMKAALPSQLPENNLAAVGAVNYNHPLHNIPVNQQQPTPQPQAHTQTPSHPQSQSHSQPQSQFRSQPPPQQPPPPPLRPQPQSQPQQPPRSIATPVVAAPSTPGSTSQSPHPTAVVNGSASTLGSSPRVATSPALHAMAIAGTNAASSSSSRPPAQSAIQPQQGQPQPRAQAQAVPQARPQFPQQAKGFGPPLQTYMNMGAAGMNPALYKQLAAQAQGQNAKAGVMGQPTQQQIYYMMPAQAQAQAHAQGQVQAVNLTPAQLQAQARYAAQVAQMQAVQAQQQQQQQQQNVPAPRTPMLNPAIVGATANSQATSRSPMPNANGQGQHVAPQHFAASGQGQQSPQLSHQQQQVMASAQAKAQYAAHLLQQQQQQQQQSHPGQTQDAAPTQQMSIPMNPMNMSPQMLQQLQLMQHAAQAQADGRVGGYPMHAWQQLQMSQALMEVVRAQAQAQGMTPT